MTDPLDGLTLEPLGTRHLGEVFALYSDPRVWTHQPDGRHRDRTRSAMVIGSAERSRSATGVGPWAVRDASGRFLGSVGVHLTSMGVWNVGFRLHPDAQGRGIATAASLRAMDEARRNRPQTAVTARVLESNAPSIRVLERIGLTVAWAGDDAAADGSTRPRRVYADRALDPDVLNALAALG